MIGGNLRAEAARWVVRLSDPRCSAEDRAGFEAWKNSSAAAAAAYEREAGAWKALDRLRSLQRPAIGDLVLSAPHARNDNLPRRVAAAALVAGVIGLIAFTTLNSSVAYATGLGERRVVVLKDGTSVELNTNSRLVVRYGRKVRDVRLVSGEALFRVDSDRRPFRIRVGDAQITARQGELGVLAGPDGARVLVRGQSATIATLEAPERQTPLAAGDEATLKSGQTHLRRLTSSEVDRDLAWRVGAIALDGETLGQAASEFNRYNRRKITVADSSISDFKVAGYFQNNDVPGFVRAVTVAFPIKATATDTGQIVLSRRD